MTYLNILSDREILTIYERIDIAKQYEPRYYGMIHALNTVEYAKKLAICFELTEKETELLLDACVLHNIGHLNGKNLHAQTGSEMAKSYLKKNNFEQRDINVISSAIANHMGRSADDFYNSVPACLILADKMDFGEARYKPYFEYTSEEDDVLRSVTYIDVNRVGDTIFLIVGGKNVNWNKFVRTSDYAKVYACFEKVCKKRNLKFSFRKKDLNK